MRRSYWLMILTVSRILMADPISISQTTGVGTTSLENEYVDELIRTELANDFPEFTVSADAPLSLKPKLFKLESRYVFVLEQYRGQVRLTTLRLNAKDSRELERVVQRVTRATLMGKTPVAVATPGNLTDEEADHSTTYQKALSHLVVGFGPSLPAAGFKSTRIMSNWILGVGWLVSDRYTLGAYLQTGSVLGANGSLTHLGFSSQYYLNDNPTAPFLHGGLGYGWGNNGDQTTITSSYGYSYSSPSKTQSGFVVEAGVGLGFFRLSKIQTQVLFRSALFLGESSTLAVTGLQFRLNIPAF